MKCLRVGFKGEALPSKKRWNSVNLWAAEIERDRETERKRQRERERSELEVVVGTVQEQTTPDFIVAVVDQAGL